MTQESPSRKSESNNELQIENSDMQKLDKDSAGQSQYLNIFAKVSQFNDRLDLVISKIEEHNPGFVKRATNNIEKYDEEFRRKRFYFGDKQAYTSLALRWIGMIFCFTASGYIIWTDKVGFWTATFLIVLLAVSQSGFSGIMKIVSGFTELVLSSRKRE